MRTCSAPANVRAARLGEYLSLAMAACTASRVSWRTLFSPLITRETVLGAKPACAATSAIVGAPCRRCLGLRLLRVPKRLPDDLVVIFRARFQQKANAHLALGTIKKANRIDKVESNPSW